MASATIGTATIVLSAQHEKMTQGFANANKQLGTFGGGLADIGKRLAATMGPAVALGAAFRTAFAEASRLDDIADATGLATSEVVQFERAALNAGVSTEGFAQAISKMNVSIGGALEGNKASVENLQKLGITMEQIAGKSPAERFRIIADAIGSIEDRAMQASAAADMFGKSSGKMIEMLGSEELRKPMDAIDADRIDRSTQALNKLSDGAASFATGFKTHVMTKIGTAADYWMQKLGMIRQSYKGLQTSADEAVTEIAKKTKEQIDKETKDRQEYINWLAKKEGEKNKSNADAYNSVIDQLNKSNAEIMRINAGADAELLAMEKEYQERFAKLQSDGMKASLTDQKYFRDAELALHAEFALKRGDINRRMADDARKRGQELESMAKTAYDAEANRATDSLKGAMGALDSWETKMKKAGDEVKKNREETKKQLGGDALVLRPKDQIKAEADAARDAEEATRKKIEIGRAYADSLGNIITMTDELGKKTKEGFFIDKGAKMAQALINSYVGYTAALALGPPAGPILAGTTLAAGFYAASQIAAQQPGRANGGPTAGGRSYEVGENGPEMFSMNGRNFILPGRDGYVNNGTPGATTTTTVNVTVNNKPGQTAVVTQSGPAISPNITIDIIDQMVAAAVSNGRSSTSRAMQSRFGLNGARGAQ